MREQISETVFQFTVMHPANMMIANLADALAEADTGNAVGDERVISTRVVPDRSVPSRLKKLGNDGTFFDDDGEYWADDEDDDENDFPQTPEEARECIHGNQVWFGHECGLCDGAGKYIWKT